MGEFSKIDKETRARKDKIIWGIVLAVVFAVFVILAMIASSQVSRESLEPRIDEFIASLDDADEAVEEACDIGRLLKVAENNASDEAELEKLRHLRGDLFIVVIGKADDRYLFDSDEEHEKKRDRRYKKLLDCLSD